MTQLLLVPSLRQLTLSIIARVLGLSQKQAAHNRYVFVTLSCSTLMFRINSISWTCLTRLIASDMSWSSCPSQYRVLQHSPVLQVYSAVTMAISGLQSASECFAKEKLSKNDMKLGLQRLKEASRKMHFVEAHMIRVPPSTSNRVHGWVQKCQLDVRKKDSKD